MGAQFFIQPAQNVRNSTANVLTVKNIIRQFVAANSEELRVGAGQKVLRILANSEQAQYGRGGAAGGLYHLCRGELFSE